MAEPSEDGVDLLRFGRLAVSPEQRYDPLSALEARSELRRLAHASEMSSLLKSDVTVEDFLYLASRVRQACGERLASILGPEAVGELPDVPSNADLADLPEAPSFDDTAAFREWRDAIAAQSFDRGLSKGKEAGLSEGFDRGLAAGQQRALFTILESRGLSVDPAAQARIEACTDPAVLKRWIAKAMTIETATDLFATGSEAS